jgi:hypothetical protein
MKWYIGMDKIMNDFTDLIVTDLDGFLHFERV